MRLLLSLVIIGQLVACTPQSPGREDPENTPYRPLPRVELSMFTAGDRIASVYVRHSRSAVLFRLLPESPGDACALRACGVKSVVTLYSPVGITFCSTPYEKFDRSYDLFGDGTVVLVPLAEEDDNAAGVFVNLASGKSYFFIPLPAKVDHLAKLRHRIKLVNTEDVRSAGA